MIVVKNDAPDYADIIPLGRVYIRKLSQEQLAILLKHNCPYVIEDKNYNPSGIGINQGVNQNTIKEPVSRGKKK